MTDPVSEPDQKKCPRCGSPLKPDKPCGKCAKEGIEISFKDFKISELLDIKMSLRRKDEDGEDGKK